MTSRFINYLKDLTIRTGDAVAGVKKDNYWLMNAIISCNQV